LSRACQTHLLKVATSDNVWRINKAHMSILFKQRIPISEFYVCFYSLVYVYHQLRERPFPMPFPTYKLMKQGYLVVCVYFIIVHTHTMTIPLVYDNDYNNIWLDVRMGGIYAKISPFVHNKDVLN
jgi:hypothetical protein